MSPKEKTEMPLVVEAIRNGYGEKGGVKSLGVNGFARASGISPALITRYLQGKVGEPTTATLQKLADYFGVSVAYLRGEEVIDVVERIPTDEMMLLAIKSCFPGGEARALEILTSKGLSPSEADVVLQNINKAFTPEARASVWANMLADLHLEHFKPLIDETFKVYIDETPIEENELEALLSDINNKLKTEVLKPVMKELELMPASELPGIAAIIKRFRENQSFNLEARKLLNNSIAHSK